MRFILLVISLFILTPPTLFSQDSLTLNAFQKRQYTSGSGDTLLYRWLAPDSVQEGQSHPLILFLHGAGERGSDNTAQLLHVLPRFAEPARRAQHPAFIFAPQCPQEDYWTNGNFAPNRSNYVLNDTMTKALTLTAQALALIIELYPVDTTRIYVVGLSMGGAGTWEMALRFPDVFAAAVPICGFSDPRYAARLTEMPIWAFHGSNDDVVPAQLSRLMVRAVNQAGGQAIYTEFPDVGHGSWVPAFPPEPFIYDWLFAQQKGQ